MKALSIEEKAKAYDNVRKKIATRFGSNVAKEIFSEYEEGEDERIRKELIGYFTGWSDKHLFRGFKAEQILAWLEKQDEKIDAIEDFDTEFEKQVSRLIASAINREHEYSQGYVKWAANALLEYAKHELEKQGEEKQDINIQINPSEYINDMGGNGCYLKNTAQKPADKVEPKFHKGDWVVCNNGPHHIFQVIERSWPNAKYRNIRGAEIFLNVNTLDKQYHLWTIKDAKDGDVLVGGEQLFLFKRMNTSNSFYAHCNYHFIGHDSLSVYDCSYSIDNIYPATKEQNDLLFQKMHEAGYEWDAEKKELKKIEQKPAEWHREDEQNLNACLGYIPDEFLRRWLTDIIHVKYDEPTELPKGEDYGIDGLYAAIDILQKTLGEVDDYQSDDGILTHKCAISAVKELSKQKPAWSEEDEQYVKDTLALLAFGASVHTISQVQDWLKALKERCTWKPSDEQMERLRGIINSLPHQEVLNSLYQDLKKLKGE